MEGVTEKEKAFFHSFHIWMELSLKVVLAMLCLFHRTYVLI